MLSVAVGRDDGLAGEALGHELETGLQRAALAAVAGMALHEASARLDRGEDVVVSRARAVVDHDDVEVAARGTQVVDEPNETGAGFVGGDQHDHRDHPAM